MTRSRKNGTIAQKSTRFNGCNENDHLLNDQCSEDVEQKWQISALATTCLKKRNFRGEKMKRIQYSNMKNSTTIFSEKKRINRKFILTSILPTVSMASRASGYGEGIPVSDSFWNSEEGMLVG